MAYVKSDGDEGANIGDYSLGNYNTYVSKYTASLTPTLTLYVFF